MYKLEIGFVLVEWVHTLMVVKVILMVWQQLRKYSNGMLT
jgi:hypothetical protein